MSKCISSAKNIKGFNRLKPLLVLSEPDWIIYDDPVLLRGPYSNIESGHPSASRMSAFSFVRSGKQVCLASK